MEERPKALKDILIHMWTIKNRGRLEQLELIKDRVRFADSFRLNET